MRFYFLLVLFFVFSITVSAQSNKILTLNLRVYDHITHLQNRGLLLELDPTSLPYTTGEVYEALLKVEEETLSEVEAVWYNSVKKVVSPKSKDVEEKAVVINASIEGGFNFKNTNRLNLLRPEDKNLYFSPISAAKFYLEGGSFGGQFNLRQDETYFIDPDGVNPFGRFHTRAEDFYFGYQAEYLKIYFGRYRNHWGVYGQSSTILSSNPFPYDNINFRFGNNRLNIEGIFGELDNLSENGDFDPFTGGREPQINGTRRYLAAHKINWSPNNSLRLSLFRTALYSSNTSSISLKYLNPFNDLLFDRTNNPNNHFNNTFIGGSLWLNKGRFTMNGQVTLDDIHLTNNDERMTASVIGMMNFSELFYNTDLGIKLEVISYQSYNTSTQISGRYLYMGRGIATQFNDYVLASVHTEHFAYNLLKGLRIKPEITLLLQGEQEIDQPFYKIEPDGSLPPFVLTGTVEQTLRGALNLSFNPIPEFWLEGEFGINDVQNKNNIENNDVVELTGMLIAGFRLSLTKILNNESK
ncbi:hypothetical protein A8B79_10290 [Balneola sp. EhC07]|nr:hypothetical protein A8B79_10290 [Balneola sp. EhC07]